MLKFIFATLINIKLIFNRTFIIKYCAGDSDTGISGKPDIDCDWLQLFHRFAAYTYPAAIKDKEIKPYIFNLLDFSLQKQHSLTSSQTYSLLNN